MSLMVAPARFAAEADAPLVECALKHEVSIPASAMMHFNQRAMVDETTG